MKARELIERLTDEEIIMIMEELGAELVRHKENEIQFTSICHGSNSEKLYYYTNTMRFKCYSHDCKSQYGNAHTIITMVQKLENIGYSETIQWIENL